MVCNKLLLFLSNILWLMVLDDRSETIPESAVSVGNAISGSHLDESSSSYIVHSIVAASMI